MATKQKAAAKPAAKQEAPADEATGFEVGQRVKFLGYDADTPEDEQVLTANETYEIVGFTEADESGEGGGDPILSIPNPEYNPKKKEHAETNPKTLEVQAFAEELEAIDDEAEEEVEEVEEAPAPAKATKAKAAPAKEAKATKAAPAKAAPGKKGKKVAKVKPPKAVKPPKEEEVDPLDVDLEVEDADVLALIEGSEDLIQTAQELEAQAATTEWQLGGILYHVRKEKPYLNLEGADKYKEKGGFELFLQDYFNVEYRKAMYLIKIYVAFNHAKIENAGEKVAAMGWTKAKTIAPLMLQEDSKADELIELAESNTVSDLSEAIKDTTNVGGTKGERVERVTLKLRFLKEAGASVLAILETAKETLGLKDIAEAALHIITEWATANAGKTPTKAAAPTQKVSSLKVVSGKKVASRAAAA